MHCGQIFRFKAAEGGYEVLSKDKRAFVVQHGRDVEVVTKDADYFENFFDLKRDYSVFLKKYGGYDFFAKAFRFGEGIRILNQDLQETIFSFIISANNNIKRIQLIIDRICNALGDDMGGYRAFPSAERLARAGEAFFADLGAGYRAPYLAKTAKMLACGFDLQCLKTLPTVEARKKLMSLCGVGPKVADCILLFGLRKTDSFPVDTWIEKVYHEHFETGLKTREDIARHLVGLFGEDAGYVQQYLFYYQRENLWTNGSKSDNI